ncbi:MAG: PAS domain-containing protein, partial [Pirellulales bacterium]|nr:PAS domain-containing protein [Pirellulales bacterium]
MVASHLKIGLSRKIVAYHLLFSLLAVCWLAAALVLTSHSLLVQRQANYLLARLGRAAAAVEMHYVRHGGDGLEAVLRDLNRDAYTLYWAVVGLDGKYLAHTDVALQAKNADEPAGVRSQRADAASVAYTNAHGQAIQEFRVALAAGSQSLGELRVAMEEPSLAATVRAALPYIPLVVLAPAGLIGLGAVTVGRLSRPMTALEDQLRVFAQVPLGDLLETSALPVRDVVSLGWNRIVDELDHLRKHAAGAQIGDRLADAEHQRREAQFEQILQRLSDGIAVTDAEGRVAFANRAINALLGEQEGADLLEGIQLDQRLLESAASPADCELLAASSLQRSAVAEVVQKGSDADRTLRVARIPLGTDGRQGHIWTLRDVTQQKLAEQSRDHFIDTATHELRTPLANIKAYAETLASAEYIDVELQKEFCNIINSEVTRLARFIDDLLSISSMEAGALTIERLKVDTQRLFSEVLSKVETLMQQKQIDFQVELPPKMPEMHLDKDKLVAVLVNVLGNAAKYTPVGGRVSLKVKAEEGRLRASVEDTGFGIAAEELPKVFDKFFRSDDPRVQAEVGTGLGLSRAREVVRMHGGELS